MNNKKLGTAFEREFCELLANKGWWVHFLAPSASGSQPFDVIACRNERCIPFDCKTSASHIFPYSRLEDNQICAFEKWLACGNENPMIAVKYKDNIYLIKYRRLKIYERIDLDREAPGISRLD